MFDSSKIKIYSDDIAKLEFELDNSYEFFYHYIKKNSEIILEIKNKLDEDLKKAISLVTDNHEDNYEYLHSEHYSAIKREYEKFKEINYKTIILHVYSFLESILRQLSIIAKSQLQLQLSYQDIKAKDNSLKLFKKYYEKVCGLTFSEEINKNWNKLFKYQLIRNIIAHNLKCDWNNKPYNDKLKQLDELIESHSLLERDYTYESFIIISDQFCLNFLDLTTAFLKQLFDVFDLSIKTNKL
jgi:hypothetical protein